MKTTFKINLLLFFVLSTQAFASSEQVGRYTTMQKSVPAEQRDVFLQTIHVHFDANTKTVGDALNGLLKLTGYSLVSNKNQSEALSNTLKKPLPLIQRDLNAMTLQSGLQILVGESFTPVKDPVNRTIDFKLKSRYQTKKHKH